MPGGDGTGPLGMGPGMGWGGGRWGCRRPGGGYGYGGHGWRNLYRATGLPGWMRGGGWVATDPYQDDISPSPNERSLLRRQAEALELELRQVKERLQELEGRPQQSSDEQGGGT